MKWLFLYYPPPPTSHTTSRHREKWAGLKLNIQGQRMGWEAGREEERLRAPRAEPRPGAGGKGRGGAEELETLGKQGAGRGLPIRMRDWERDVKPKVERAYTFRYSVRS